MPGGQPQLCRDKSTRAARPRRATCQRIAATGANRAVVTALKNEASGVLEGAAVDANLEHAAVKAVLKVVIVAEHKTGVLEERNRHRRRMSRLSLTVAGSLIHAAFGSVSAGGDGNPELDVCHNTPSGLIALWHSNPAEALAELRRRSLEKGSIKSESASAWRWALD